MTKPEVGRPLLLPDRVWAGFLFAAVLQIVMVVLLLLPQPARGYVSFWAMFVIMIGAAQLLWLGPMALFFLWTGRRAMLKGVFLVMGVTVLLNGSCFAIGMF